MELPGTLTLKDGGLVLRDWAYPDAAALRGVCGDPDVCRFTTVPWTYSEEAARAWIARLREQRAAGTGLALAVTRADAGTALGNVNLVRFSPDRREAALGYWVVPAARRQGLAVQSARMLADWGFAELGLARIEIAVLPENVPSQRVAERLGARREGIRPDSHEADGVRWDMLIYALGAGA